MDQYQILLQYCPAGVPQGSILGPLLFLIYVNSITEVTISPLARCILYADDVLLYCPFNSQSDYAMLQNDINAISECSDGHYLTLNAAKCKYMILSRKRARSDPILPLALNGTALDKVVTFKYNLSWSNHISNACTKARKVLGLLYRRFYNYASNDCLKQFYISLARPHLEYAAALWDPHTAIDIQLLENTQKFALKLITHNWDSSYQDLLALSDLPSLSLLAGLHCKFQGRHNRSGWSGQNRITFFNAWLGNGRLFYLSHGKDRQIINRAYLIVQSAHQLIFK